MGLQKKKQESRDIRGQGQSSVFRKCKKLQWIDDSKYKTHNTWTEKRSEPQLWEMRSNEEGEQSQNHETKAGKKKGG